VEHPSLLQYWREPAFWLGGKTVVGGLLGGLVAAELAKRRMGVKARTGNLFAIPLAVGIAIGRIGCFLTGLSDGRYGTRTTFWTGVDFGDGVFRYPTQLYEIAFLLLLIPMLKKVGDRATRVGDQFRVFMIAYLAFRLVVDNLKPDPPLALGLSLIQWACVAMLVYYARDLFYSSPIGADTFRPLIRS
jgi:phosphatidylglycerol---prolipoprotein diacylglyceryl transferase